MSNSAPESAPTASRLDEAHDLGREFLARPVSGAEQSEHREEAVRQVCASGLRAVMNPSPEEDARVMHGDRRLPGMLQGNQYEV